MSDRSSRFPKPGPTAAFLLPTLWIVAAELGAQGAVVTVEENFRSEPNGTVVGRLEPGTRLTVVDRDGNWTRATLEGFVWTASMQVRAQGAFDLIVSEPEGENLRDAPSGRIAGRLSSGALLEEVERVPGWVRVRRTAWIWTPSLEFEAPVEADEGEVREEGAAVEAVSVAQAGAEQDGAAQDGASGEPAAWLRVGAPELQLRSEPDGDPIAQALSGADFRVLSEEGNWARVRMEGWIWMPDLDRGSGDDAEAVVLRDVRAADFAAEPDRYRGRLVEIDLQFVSLETAEQVRTDFYRGEPFLLTRSLEGDRTFVYVAVPPERRVEVETLTPLETIRVLARVRSGAAAFTGNPILDLREVERVR